jgi:hypothetical protein
MVEDFIRWLGWVLINSNNSRFFYVSKWPYH